MMLVLDILFHVHNNKTRLLVRMYVRNVDPVMKSQLHCKQIGFVEIIDHLNFSVNQAFLDVYNWPSID